MKTTAIIVAAGRGLRMGGGIGKPFIPIGGCAILSRTLNIFDRVALIDRILVVVSEGEMAYVQDHILSPHTLSKEIELVSGGRHRQASVYNGLCRIPEKNGMVLIHDGVRPFVQPQQIIDSILMARKTGACILAIPVTDTLKEADQHNSILSTLDRRMVWAAQTPQTFRFSVIWEAHQVAIKRGYMGTDDAQLVEQTGRPVAVIPGSRFNIKITMPEDLNLAEAFLAASLF
jgi:2-C-methyl-D-erythritol 4-phosphate cytidylyltransferase